MKSRLLGAVCANVFILCISTSASAALVTYNARPDFETAISAFTSATVDFDSASVGDTIPSGGTFDGITFTYSLTDLASDPLTMVVDGFFDTTSPPNYLALQTLGGDFVNFVTGDTFSMAFSQPVNAIGLSIIANDVLLLGDSFSLTVGGLGAIISAPLAPSATLTDGGQVYFLGVTSDLAFTSAVFGSNGSGLEFALDDITHAAVPLPPAIWLLASGLGFFGLMARRKVNS
ncbi:MAG: VPLPA-CTERM sorting domain-containing protein [Gammaproteobacteria bacterium]|nr:VPLPA-CTERM sorting domain-containing protein [Gammaproteobacteria bacterium]